MSTSIIDIDLTDEQRERLALLLEECGEVQQVIGKILRHGYNTYNPFGDVTETNRVKLCKEVADILLAIKLMLQEGDLIQSRIDTFYAEKRESVNKYLHFNSVKL